MAAAAHLLHRARRMRRQARRCAAMLVVLCCGLGSPATAQTPPASAQAKARIITTLARFAQWPGDRFSDDAQPLRLCVAHDSAGVGAAFAAHHGTRLGTRSLEIVPNPAAIDVAGCHLLFVDDSAARSSIALLERHRGAAVLTVGLVDGFLSRGGMIELVNVNDVFRFDVDLRAIREASLTVASGVLKLARQVHH